MRSDLTAIYYTGNNLPERFDRKIQANLLKALDGLPLLSVSQKPMLFGINILVGEIGRSHFNIYRQALKGAKHAKTKYIALCEDDILYHKSHFEHVPSDGVFAYNMSVWGLYTWVTPALFSYKGRRNLSGLICERDLFINAMEERFKRWPDDTKTNKDLWAEPGKYERQLGVTIQQTEEFYSDIPNIAFSHETALSFEGLGKRKKIGHMRAYEIPYWGRADDIKNLYQ